VSNLNLNKQERFMALYQPQHARLSRFVQTLIWYKEDAKDYLLNTKITEFKIKNNGVLFMLLGSILYICC
jgi:hypothetical protein